MVKVDYIIDNETWSDEEFDKQQEVDRSFIITEEMIIQLIKQNVKLGNGDDIAEVYVTKY
jgi:hypothetical protein